MKHIDSILHVRGESQYTDEGPVPEAMVYCAVFSSPLAHGKILSLGTEKALSSEGVSAVITADHIPGENQIGSIFPDEVLLAQGEVHFQGQPIALIVAKSPEIARRALSLIEIDLEPLPVIVHPKTAYEKGHIIGTPRTFAMGDVDQTWEECEYVVEGTCEIGGQEHLYLETQRARAIPQEKGGMVIFSSTQSPYSAQKMLARVLGVANHKIEVDVKRLGGAFGGKEDQATGWACLAGLAAWKVQKPVELVLNRLEDMKMTGKRHPYHSEFKIGASKDGKILAYEVRHYQNAGAFADLSPAILERTLFHSTGSYYIPHVKIFACSCRTNLPSNTAFRGFGGPQGMFVLESALAEIARVSGISREKIQRKNLLAEGDFFPYGQQAQRCHAQKTWDKGAELYHLEDLQKKIRQYNSTHKQTKKGLALMPLCFGISFTSIFLNQGNALVHVYTDGSVSITTGGIEMGQGVSTNMVTLAARTLGISPGRIKIESTNTTRIANMSPSAASATTDLNGHATMLATGEILEGLKKYLAQERGLDNWQKLSMKNEKVYYGEEELDLTWEKLVEKAYFARVGLSAYGHYATPNIWFDKSKEDGQPFAYHVYGMAITGVTVDGLRGTYDIDFVKILHDLGRGLNRTIDLGQIEGGLAQGLGWMTLEELVFGDDGRLASHALATYKAPDVYFMPDDVEVKFLESSNPPGPYGSKAVGEPPLMYGIGVFFAIQQAIQAFRPGKALDYHSPMTPERVLLSLYRDFGRAGKERQ